MSDKAIVLQSIKHGDHKYLLKLFTSHHGLVTAAVSVSKSLTSKIRPGSIQVLHLLDVELILKQNKEICQLTEASCYYSATGISGSMIKLSIAQFLNEVMIKSLKEQGPNAHLYEFIEHVIRYLSEAEDEYLNLHLYFMLELCTYLGFEPQNNYDLKDRYFDCREGKFSNFELAFPLGLSSGDSEVFSGFLKTNSLTTKISTAQRQMLLDILLAYYRLHVPGFNEVKSLEVLKEVTRA
ncbi:MAG: DNA repair protein RecO [bacterium]|nr:DNA repair protein RecO [bacterium]